MARVMQGDCAELLDARFVFRGGFEDEIALTFLDPPFNQGKEYGFAQDDLPDSVYWPRMKETCARVRALTHKGGAIYFMHREKNTEYVLNCLRDSGWALQNLIVWTKMTSAVPSSIRFGKAYQIIAYATNGQKPRTFNHLRIDAPLRPGYKLQRRNGLLVTDVWDDIRELTSGYFAGEEALRSGGDRSHKQQSPVSLLLRIILASTMPGEEVLDPFAGTGTTLVVAEQLGRRSIGIEIDPKNVRLIQDRLSIHRKADSVTVLRSYYRHTHGLAAIWPEEGSNIRRTELQEEGR